MNASEPITKWEGIVYVNYHYGDHVEHRFYDFVEYWGIKHRVEYDYDDMFAPFNDKKIRITIEVLDENPEGVVKGDF